MSWGLKHFWSQFQVPEQVFPWKLPEKSFYLLNICYLIHNFKLNCYFFCTFRCSVAQSCPTLCDPMDCSMPGFPVHYLLEFCSNSCPLSQWCRPTISSSVTPFSCLQSFPSRGSFPMSQLFASGGQSIRASASTSVLPINIQGWFPLGWTGLISLLSKGLSRVFSSTAIWRHQFFSTQPSLWSSSHIHTWLQVKPQLWLYGPCQQSKVMSAF